MKSTKLNDGTKVYCIKAPEAKMLDHRVDGYLQHGISTESYVFSNNFRPRFSAPKFSDC